MEMFLLPCIHVYIYICIPSSVCVYTHIYMYIYICIPSSTHAGKVLRWPKAILQGNMKFFPGKMKVKTCTICEIGSSTEEENGEIGVLAL